MYLRLKSYDGCLHHLRALWATPSLESTISQTLYFPTHGSPAMNLSALSLRVRTSDWRPQQRHLMRRHPRNLWGLLVVPSSLLRAGFQAYGLALACLALFHHFGLFVIPIRVMGNLFPLTRRKTRFPCHVE